jgi:hypothetical protein
MASRSPLTEPGHRLAAFEDNTDWLSWRFAQRIPFERKGPTAPNRAKGKGGHPGPLSVRARIGCKWPPNLPRYRDQPILRPNSC